LIRIGALFWCVAFILGGVLGADHQFDARHDKAVKGPMKNPAGLARGGV